MKGWEEKGRRSPEANPVGHSKGGVEGQNNENNLPNQVTSCGINHDVGGGGGGKFVLELDVLDFYVTIMITKTPRCPGVDLSRIEQKDGRRKRRLQRKERPFFLNSCSFPIHSWRVSGYSLPYPGIQ